MRIFSPAPCDPCDGLGRACACGLVAHQAVAGLWRFVRSGLALVPCRVRPALRYLRRSAQQGFTSLSRSAQQGFTPLSRSAQQGFTPLSRSAQQGFTLIELMVVIAIIGFASSAVILAIPDPRGRLVDDADRFAVRLAAVRDLAVTRAQPLALWVSASGYGFQARENGVWQESSDAPFAVTQWKAGTQAQLGRDQQGGNRLMVSFDSTGLPNEPARVVLSRDGEEVAVTLDGAGRVRVGE